MKQEKERETLTTFVNLFTLTNLLGNIPRYLLLGNEKCDYLLGVRRRVQPMLLGILYQWWSTRYGVVWRLPYLK